MHCLGTDVWPAYPFLLSGLISQAGNLEHRSNSDLSIVPSHLQPYQELTQQFSHDSRLSYRRVAGRFRSLDLQFPRVETARYHMSHSSEPALPLRYRVQRGTEADPTPGNLGHTTDKKVRRTIWHLAMLTDHWPQVCKAKPRRANGSLGLVLILVLVNKRRCFVVHLRVPDLDPAQHSLVFGPILPQRKAFRLHRAAG